MPKNVDLWLRSAQADFQAAAHQGAADHSDPQPIRSRLEDMVQSIALGMNEFTEVLRAMNNRISHIETLVQAQEMFLQQDRSAQQESRARCAVVR